MKENNKKLEEIIKIWYSEGEEKATKLLFNFIKTLKVKEKQTLAGVDDNYNLIEGVDCYEHMYALKLFKFIIFWEVGERPYLFFGIKWDTLLSFCEGDIIEYYL